MECPVVPEMDLAEFGLAIKQKLNGKRFPLSASFELTERCNFNCVHCYINQPAGSQSARTRELSTSQVKQVLDQMAEMGTLFLTLTGGEPLLRSDFPEIYRHARRLGLITKVFTNGTLLTAEIADLFQEFTPQVVDITLYGATRETYEQVTRVKGSFDRVMHAIELLREQHVPFSLKTMVLTINQHEYPKIQSIADELGVKFRYDGLLMQRLDGRPGPGDYQISLQDLKELILRKDDPSSLGDWLQLADRDAGISIRAEYLFPCAAGKRAFHLDCQGKMSACMTARRVTYNVMQLGLKQAWEALGEYARSTRQLDTPCRTCTINSLCLQCPGWSQLTQGDDEDVPEFVCGLARSLKKEIEYSRNHSNFYEFCYNELKGEEL